MTIYEAFEFFDMKPSDFSKDFHLKFKLDLPSLFKKFQPVFFRFKRFSCCVFTIAEVGDRFKL